MRNLIPAMLILGLCATSLAGPDGDVRRGGSRWGESYFPNVPLITHEGKTVRFFDDLIKDKVVVINFIYTRCPDVCPLETAQLAEMQAILGDRVGKDVFMYSISIDPEYDTPEVLKAYAESYKIGPGWLFLTGKESDIVLLRRKLGLYIAEIQGVRDDDTRDHNVSMVIGNQATGRWMKRSPFENPYVLARQVGNWLHNWKMPGKEKNDFADAPKLRNLTRGESLFRSRCAVCHTIGGRVESGAARVGPDLMGVTARRDPQWLARWLADPDKLLREKDPLAMELFARHGNLVMPNMALNDLDVTSLIGYLEAESRRVEAMRRNRLVGVDDLDPDNVPKCCQKGQATVLTASVVSVERRAKSKAGGNLSLAAMLVFGTLGGVVVTMTVLMKRFSGT